MKNILTITLSLICSISFGQTFKVNVNYVLNDGSGSKTNIFYSNTKVNWIDFKGKPDLKTGFQDLTFSEIGMQYEMNQDGNDYTLNIDVCCDFSKLNSWKIKQSDYLLVHEQHHFDITFIYTQLFIQRLRQANFTYINYESLMNNIYNEVQDEWNKEEVQYDLETHHSEIVSKQQEWNSKIDNELLQISALK